MKNALRPIGLALLAIAIVGAILVPTRAEGWNAHVPLARNLQNAAVIVRYETPPARSPLPDPCPTVDALMQRTHTRDLLTASRARNACLRGDVAAWRDATREPVQWRFPARVVVVSAGDAFAALAALALAGVGLIVFAPRGTQP